MHSFTTAAAGISSVESDRLGLRRQVGSDAPMDERRGCALGMPARLLHRTMVRFEIGFLDTCTGHEMLGLHRSPLSLGFGGLPIAHKSLTLGYLPRSHHGSDLVTV